MILLRHGVPELAGTLLGRLDVPSTPAGIERCLEATAMLDFGRIVSSPLSRALAAAERIATRSGQRTQVDARWRELDFGDWDGRTVRDIDETEGAALASFWRDPDLHPPPGGERWSEIKARVAAAVVDIVAGHDGRSILVVAHAGAMRAAIAGLCGFDFAQTMNLDLPYAAQVHLRLFAEAERPVTAIIRGLQAP